MKIAQHHRLCGEVINLRSVKQLLTSKQSSKRRSPIIKPLQTDKHPAILHLLAAALMHQAVDHRLEHTIPYILDATMIAKMIVPFHSRFHPIATEP
jgi:hypothetical protein